MNLNSPSFDDLQPRGSSGPSTTSSPDPQTSTMEQVTWNSSRSSSSSSKMVITLSKIPTTPSATPRLRTTTSTTLSHFSCSSPHCFLSDHGKKTPQAQAEPAVPDLRLQVPLLVQETTLRLLEAILPLHEGSPRVGEQRAWQGVPLPHGL